MGRLFQINISDGGVPKLAIVRAEVGFAGVAGDRQQDLKHHGGPDRAVCLFSLERILSLQREGHPIIPGSTGENLTLADIDWNRVIPGVRMKIGDGLEIEITAFTEPCRFIAGSFRDAAIERILQGRHPGWSRLYAKVTTAGRIAVGDIVQMTMENNTAAIPRR